MIENIGFAKEHLPESQELYDYISSVDFNLCNDFFCFKYGGDADNGEVLMDYFDMFFSRKRNGLRPCPFCGGEVKLDKNKHFTEYAGNSFDNSYAEIRCEKCGINMSVYPESGYGATDEQIEQLICKWNSRRFGNHKVEPVVAFVRKDGSHAYCCPICGAMVYNDEDGLANTDMFCPNCNIELDWTERG